MAAIASLEVEPFDVCNLLPTGSAAVIAPRGRGKTTVVRWLLAELKRQASERGEEMTTVICAGSGTPAPVLTTLRQEYKNEVPWTSVQASDGDDIASTILSFQDSSRTLRGAHYFPYTVVVFTDQVLAKSKQSRGFVDLIKNGRHYNCFVIVEAQYPSTHFTPDIRSNLSYAFVKPGAVSTEYCRKLWQNFFGQLHSAEAFGLMVATVEYHQRHAFLVSDNGRYKPLDYRYAVATPTLAIGPSLDEVIDRAEAPDSPGVSSSDDSDSD